VPNTPDVVDRHDEQRFVVELDGHTAELTYRLDGDRLTLIHTGVPDELEGQGIGSALVRGAVDRAAEDELTLVPRCAFARRWLTEHPDVASTVPIDWPPDQKGGR